MGITLDKMKISFTALTGDHFPLLLKWLNTPHVKKWWDPNIQWTKALIAKKYTPYINAENKIHAYIIEIDQEPIGYIQYYNAYEFSREIEINPTELPKNLAAIDVYTGEPHWLGKGIASTLINEFLECHGFPGYEAVFVDPDIENKGAIKTYEKAGFIEIKRTEKSALMLKYRGRIGTPTSSPHDDNCSEYGYY